VVQLRELLGRERLGRTDHHVAGVVDHHVDAAVLGLDGGDRPLDGLLGAHVELHRPQVHAVLGGVRRGSLDLRGVAAARLAHARVDRVAGVGQRAGRQGAEPGRGPCDDDDVAHDLLLLLSASGPGAQAMPPLTYRTWPLTQRAGPARKATVSATSSGVPRRSSGASRARVSIVCSSLPSRNRGVAVGPGATALTVTSLPRSSRASTRVSASTAALEAAYGA